MNLNQDHAEIAWGNWTAQFGSDKRLEALVKALHSPNNLFQTALLQLYNDRWLDTAVGRQLDGIGEIVGLAREIDEVVYTSFFGFLGQPGVTGFDGARLRREYENAVLGSTRLLDPEYRKLLYWKIAVNNGHGTTPEIAASLKAIFDLEHVIIQNEGNAKIRIWLSAYPTINDVLLSNARRWVPSLAGVGITVITGSSGLPFGFSNQGYYGFGVGTLARNIE